MKRIFLITLITLLNININAQTSDEFLNSGIEKHNSKDYKGALKDYSKAIKKDKNNAFAYYNRGLIELATSDFKLALSDFTKTIELKNTYIDAYYSRATVYANLKDYKKAISDLDVVIKENEKFPNALTLRGQLHFGMENKGACCKDFERAKQIGDKSADKYLSKYCGNEQQAGESLSLHWPENENWKLEDSQENEQMMMIELLRNNETFDNWTEIGTMMSIKGAINIPMDNAMNMMFEQAKKEGKDSKLTFIEKDESCEFPWILFKIETSKHKKGDKGPESQLWYIVQGKTSLYTNFRAVKEKEISKELETKWIVFFKAGKVVYQNN